MVEIPYRNLDYKEVVRMRSDEIKQLVLDDIESSHRNFSVGNQLRNIYITCPRCVQRNLLKGEVYNKRKLGVSPDYSSAHCFRCELTIVDPIASGNRDVATYIRNTNQRIDDFTPVTLDDTQLSNVISHTVNMSAHNDDMFDYYKERNKYYNCSDNPFHFMTSKGKLLIPYFDENQKLIYYQIRYKDINMSPTKSKYFNPVISNKPIYITPEVDDGFIKWDAMRPTILVEGALTAAALKCTIGSAANVVAMIGKSFTDYQIDYLRKLSFLNIYVMLDETELSQKQVINLMQHSITAEVIPSDGRDAEEMINEIGIDDYRTLILNCIRKDEELKFGINKFNTSVKKEVKESEVSFGIRHMTFSQSIYS